MCYFSIYFLKILSKTFWILLLLVPTLSFSCYIRPWFTWTQNITLSPKIQEETLELMNEWMKWNRGLLPTFSLWVYFKCMVSFSVWFLEEITLTLLYFIYCTYYNFTPITDTTLGMKSVHQQCSTHWQEWFVIFCDIQWRLTWSSCHFRQSQICYMGEIIHDGEAYLLMH